MKRTLFLGALILIALGIPRAGFALVDGYTSDASTSESSCRAESYSCSCVGASTSTVSESAEATGSVGACDSFCQDVNAESYTYTCTLTDGTAGHQVAQGNVGTSTPVATPEEGIIESIQSFDAPTLLVDIPGFNGFTTPSTNNDGNVVVNFLAEYINAIYRWVLGAGALAAVVLMMIGGLQYVLSRGKEKYITKAKARITNAITGLVLILAAYNIAFLIDPRLTSMKPLDVRSVDYVELTNDSEDTGGDGADPLAQSYSAAITCDPNVSLYEIAMSTKGHVTYRMGGKIGKTAPFGDDASKIDPRSGNPYRSFCPEGQLCLDCSGYASFITKCAGLPSAGESGGTKGIFATNSERIIPSTVTDTSINGVALKPGDLIGWPKPDEPKKSGHVVIYIGNGKVAESHGGSGRQEGRAVSITSTSAYISQIVSGGKTMYLRRR